LIRSNTPVVQGWSRALTNASFVTGLCILLVLIFCAVVSAFWSPYPVAEIDIPNKLAIPNAKHWLGTDSLGRDIASLLWVGSQNTLLVGLIAVGIGLSVGVPLGLLASAKRGWTEEVIMRASDFTFAFPALLSAILLTAIYGPGLVISITAIGIFNIPVFARITRGAANAIWTRDYTLAAKAAGKSEWAITWQHVLPNMASVLIVQASAQFAIAILAEAALSYLGLGTQAPQASWGRMLNEAQSQMFQAPWLAVYPGMAIAIAVLGLNLLGDGLRDLMDPRLARLR
jgi:peptide/nickel transport system permease protein